MKYLIFGTKDFYQQHFEIIKSMGHAYVTTYCFGYTVFANGHRCNPSIPNLGYYYYKTKNSALNKAKQTINRETSAPYPVYEIIYNNENNEIFIIKEFHFLKEA